MSDTAAVRALRTMDLIPYILEHPGISINQLSKIFNVAEKEIENEKFIIHNSQKFNTIKIISDEQR